MMENNFEHLPGNAEAQVPKWDYGYSDNVSVSNVSYEITYYRDLSQIESVRLSFLAVYLVIIVSSVLGNALVLFTVARQKKLHNSVNFLTCNLAVSDLLVGAFVAPAKLIELIGGTDSRIFGVGLCTCLCFTQSLTVFSTIMTLLVVAAERYLVIVHPLRSRRFKRSRRLRILLALVWLIAFLLSTPNLIPARDYEFHSRSELGSLHRAGCRDSYDLVHDNFRQSYFLFLSVMLYVIPSLTISYVSCRVGKVLSSANYFEELQCLQRRIPRALNDEAVRKQMDNRRKVAFMMLIVNLAYLVCWSPYFIITIITQFESFNFFETGNFYFTMLCINGSGFLNSALNPFIYLMAPRFRQSFYTTLYQLLPHCLSQGNSVSAERLSIQRDAMFGSFYLRSQYSSSSSNNSFYRSWIEKSNRNSGKSRLSGFNVSMHRTPIASNTPKILHHDRGKGTSAPFQSLRGSGWKSSGRHRRRASSLPSIGQESTEFTCQIDLITKEVIFSTKTFGCGSSVHLGSANQSHQLSIRQEYDCSSSKYFHVTSELKLFPCKSTLDI